MFYQGKRLPSLLGFTVWFVCLFVLFFNRKPMDQDVSVGSPGSSETQQLTQAVSQCCQLLAQLQRDLHAVGHQQVGASSASASLST